MQTASGPRHIEAGFALLTAVAAGWNVVEAAKRVLHMLLAKREIYPSTQNEEREKAILTI